MKRRCNVLVRFWKSAFRSAAAGNRKKPALFWDRSAGKKRGSRLFLQSAVDWIVRRSFLGLSGDADEEKNERQKRTEGKRSMCDTRGSLYAAFAFLFVSTARSVSSFAATDVVASASSAFCLGKPRVLFEWIGRDLHPFLLFSPFYFFFFFSSAFFILSFLPAHRRPWFSGLARKRFSTRRANVDAHCLALASRRSDAMRLILRRTGKCGYTASAMHEKGVVARFFTYKRTVTDASMEKRRFAVSFLTFVTETSFGWNL